MRVSSRVTGKPLDEDVRDVAALLDGAAEVAGREVGHVAAELDGDGLIEPEATVEVRAELRGGAFLERRDARVARQEPGHREDEEDDPEQDRQMPAGRVGR